MAGINEAVLGAIDTMIAQHVSATPMDLTVNAEVVKLKNPSTSEWLVKYENNTFSAFSQNTQLMFETGEQVFVLVPQGNFSSKKIIIGRASAQNNMTDTEIYEASNFYLPMSENWLGPTLYGQVNKDGEGKEYPGVSRLNLEICSCPRSERHSLMHQKGANYTDYAFGRWPYQKRPEVMDGLPKGKNDIAYGENVGYVDPPSLSHYHAEDNDPAVFPTPQVLKICDDELMWLSNRYDLVWIGIKAKFRTEFMATHTTGTYGIRVEYLTANPKYIKYESGRVLTPDASPYNVKSIELTLDNFGGNPYALVSPTEIVGYFKVNRHEFMGLNRVCLFQNSETETFKDTADMTIDYVPVYDENGVLTYSPDTEVRDRNNVFATDIDIRWYEKINLLDRDHWVWITSDQGHSVFNETDDHVGIPRVTLKAHLYFNGRDLLNEPDAEDNYDVIWYRELPGARTTDAPQGDQESNDRLWKAFVGDGWAPIFRPKEVPFTDDLERNIKGIIWGSYYVEEVQPSVVNQYGQKVGPNIPSSYHLTSEGTWPPMKNGKYDPDDLKTNRDAEPYQIASFRELIVPRDRVAWMWRYSCAVIPKVKRENTIDNDGQVVEKKDVSTNYYYYQESSGITAGYEVWRRDSRYDMDIEIQDGLTLGGTRKKVRVINKKDMSTLDAAPEPRAYWYANCHSAAAASLMYTAFSNLTKEDYQSGHTEQRNAYRDVNNIRGGYLNSTDNWAEIKQYPDRGFFDVTDAASGSAMRLILGLIDPDYVDTEHDGIVDIGNGIRYANELIGVWNETFFPPGKDFDVKWVGQKEFTYDGDGNAKDWFNSEGQTLKLVILSKKNTCPHIRLYGPGGLELEALDSENPNEGVELRTISGVQSMVQTAYLEATGTLSSSADTAAVIHFTVSQVWDQAMVNGDNIFFARVEMADRTLSEPIPCPLHFTKDNGDGANGTGWSFFLAPVIVESDDEARYQTPYRDQKTTAAPIVVERAKPGSPWVEMKDASGQPKHRVVIRPFIFKAGQGTGARASGQKASDEKITYGEFNELPVEEGYWAEIEWDARFPDIGCPYTYDGMLRFVNPGDTAVVSAEDYARKKQKFSAVLKDGSGQDLATVIPRGQDKRFQGVCAYTHTHERVMDEDGTAEGVYKTYGAIDVRWNDELGVDPLQSGGAGMRFGKENYRPVIKATVKIYDGCYVQQGSAYKIDPRASTKRWITTLTSYYPVDVFVRFANECIGDKANFEFDPKKVYLNWPRSVTYSAIGDQPIVSGELNEGLTFNYGEYKTKDEKRKDYVLRGSLYEGDAVVHDSPWYPAVQMTDNIKLPFEKGNINSNGDWDESTINTQTQLWTSVEDIIDVKAPRDENGKLQTTKKRFQWVQKFEPDPQLCLDGYMQSVLHTDYNKYYDTLGRADDKQGIPKDYRDRTVIYDVSGEGGNKNPREYDGDPFNGCGVYIRTQYIIYRTNECTAINNWDGVSIVTDTTNGAILAPMVAAGYKEPATNKFTGVVIGYNKMFRKDGIYGTDRTEGDMRQFEATGGYDYFASRYPYMAGVYGYQNEIPSFGLMENGTAFFGRADGGAQIVIDGTNAVLWGGGNGLLPGKQSIEDDMWNCMRITLMDLTKDASRKRIYQHGSVEAPDTEGVHTDVRFNLPEEYNPDVCPMGDNGWSSQASFVDYFRGTNEKHSRTNRYAFPYWYEEIWSHCYRNEAGQVPWYLETATMYQKYAPDDINYWDDGVWIDTKGAWAQDPDKLAKLGDKNAPVTTFRYSRASTTPAIEIGQHPEGLMPGIIPWCQSVDILRNLYIPGDRNFMVTYDGTMWAMNGVFLGNIIGSNFVGGRIQGCELGIGTNPSSRMPYAFQKVDECDWPPLMAPSFTWTNDPISDSFVQIGADLDCLPSLYADGAGNLTCSSIHIYGGSIDIGTFHIRGKEHTTDSESAVQDDYGELIQYGKSDFIGLVHCYGNLGIGPNLNDGIECGSNYGHLTQIKGQVLLGIVYSEGDTSAHEKVAEGLGMTKQSGKNASKLEYHGTNIESGSTVQELAFFGIDARDTPSKDGDAYWGHFWPMFFRYSPEEDLKDGQDIFGSGSTEHMPGWFGTMEAFKSDAGVVPAACKGQGETSPVGEGGNYFRVGPWGTESMYIFLRKEFQKEDECDIPRNDNYYGYIGVTERKGSSEGDATTWAIGMSSWGRSPIIFNSDEAIALRAQYQVEIASNPFEPEERDGYDHIPRAAGWSSMVVGYYKDPDGVTSGKIMGQATKGYIGFTCPAEEGTDDNNPLYAPKNHKPGDECKGGITIKPYDEGAPQNGFWAWIGDDKEMHLMCGLKDNAPETAEIHMTKEHVGINAPEKFWITINKGAHNESDGMPGLLISEDETKIGGSGGYIKMGDEISFEGDYADEEKQKNIYARFA